MTTPKRQKEIRRALVRLAYEVDPDGARFQMLARAIGVHHNTVTLWITNGGVPELRARDINRRFGDVLAPLSVLTGGKS